ncbi:MAG: hypothetical protein LBM75_02070 [Myxococcales bacterium]|jgi:hypothetical protein|nr:hypothetical protein [Myxococcales bacterium]
MNLANTALVEEETDEILQALDSPSRSIPGALLGPIISLGRGGQGIAIGLTALNHRGQNLTDRIERKALLQKHRDPGDAAVTSPFDRKTPVPLTQEHLKNPDEVTRSNLQMLFSRIGSTAGAVGIFSGAFACFWRNDRACRALLRGLFPKEPWMHTEGWHLRELRSSNRPSQVRRRDQMDPLISMPLTGLGLIAVGVNPHRHFERLGSACLEPSERPISAGGRLRTWLSLLPPTFTGEVPVELDVECQAAWIEPGAGDRRGGGEEMTASARHSATLSNSRSSTARPRKASRSTSASQRPPNPARFCPAPAINLWKPATGSPGP